MDVQAGCDVGRESMYCGGGLVSWQPALVALNEEAIDLPDRFTAPRQLGDCIIATRAHALPGWVVADDERRWQWSALAANFAKHPAQIRLLVRRPEPPGFGRRSIAHVKVNVQSDSCIGWIAPGAHPISPICGGEFGGE
jgi:hypothetical protein